MKEGDYRPQGESKENQPQSFQIAIDGTVAAGKGTVSRALAERLDFLYVDTGAMYRCVSFIAIETNTSPQDEDALVEEVKKRQISLRRPNEDEKDGRLITVLLNDEDVSWKIRSEQVGALSSVTAQHPKIRAELVRQQQQISASQNVVMEGRDITHTVLPNAQLKIFLDADPLVRAQRRHQELQLRGVNTTLEEVLADLRVRDQRDLEKNLKRIPGVWDIDASNMTTEEVISLIFSRAKALMDSKE